MWDSKIPPSGRAAGLAEPLPCYFVACSRASVTRTTPGYR
ncbi:hypothetical protein HMPREF1548_06370 [Clostridium sp. KLE 1755]|nr:hypothetical protein HMPREF1548_06370 [Clostridium sp. KLE 1755]